MTTDINQFIGQFPLPEAAMKDIQAMALKQAPVMEGVNALVSGHQGGCSFRFEQIAIKNTEKTRKLKYDKFDTEIICRFFPDRKSESIVKVYPKNEFPESLLYIDPDTQEIFGEMADAYKRFLEGKSASGTPLRKWGQIEDAAIASLESARIYTVEQIANMNSAIWLAKFGHDFDEVYEQATLFVAAKDVEKRADKQADELVKVIDEKNKLEAEVRAMQKQIAELIAKGKANKATKRGRPKKQVEEERTDEELLEEASRA